MESFTSCLLLFSVVSPISALIDHLTITECMPMDQELGRISSVSVTPYPPQLPGTLTVSANVLLNRPVQGNITLSLEVHKKLGFLGFALPIPCIKHVGSCTYVDVCSLLSQAIHKTTTTTTPSSLQTSADFTVSAAGTDNSISPSHNPASLSSNPVSVTDNPASFSSEPVSVTDNPTSVSSEPVSITDNPASFSSEPVSITGTDNPAIFSSEPVSVTDNPASVSSEPVSITDNPASFSSEPVSVTDNPASVSINPVALEENGDSTTLDASAPSSSEQPSKLASSTRPSSGQPAGECPKLLADNNMPCQCPFEAGFYTLPPTTFNVPDLGPLSSLAMGDYQIKLRFSDTSTGKMLMCQVVELTISDNSTPTPCTGFACVVG